MTFLHNQDEIAVRAASIKKEVLAELRLLRQVEHEVDDEQEPLQPSEDEVEVSSSSSEETNVTGTPPDLDDLLDVEDQAADAGNGDLADKNENLI
ncbi:unnamed protein product, partial [Amoebophrya sp. A25]|eukprot:GSA25T00002978001.1